MVGTGRTVQFFRSSANGSNFGEGQALLFSATEGSAADLLTGTGTYGPVVNGVTVGTDAAALFRFRMPLASSGGIAIGDRITALAKGSTSEFGPSVIVGTYHGQSRPQVSVTSLPTGTTAAPVLLTGSVIDDDSVRWTALADMGDGSAQYLLLSPTIVRSSYRTSTKIRATTPHRFSFPTMVAEPASLQRTS